MGLELAAKRNKELEILALRMDIDAGSRPTKEMISRPIIGKMAEELVNQNADIPVWTGSL